MIVAVNDETQNAQKNEQQDDGDALAKFHEQQVRFEAGEIAV